MGYALGCSVVVCLASVRPFVLKWMAGKLSALDVLDLTCGYQIMIRAKNLSRPIFKHITHHCDINVLSISIVRHSDNLLNSCSCDVLFCV